MKKNRILLLLLIAGVAINGCQKENVGDGKLNYIFTPTNLSASLSSTASGSGLPVAPLSNGSITWNTGRINIKSISFSSKKANNSVSLEYTKLSNIDILKSGILSGSLAIPTGTYNDIKLKLNLAVSNTDKPLVLLGTYTEVSGTKIPVEFQFNENYELKISPPEISIKGDIYDVNVTLDIAKLVKNTIFGDFGNTSRSGTDKMILINSSTNRALYEKLMVNLASIPDVKITKK